MRREGRSEPPKRGESLELLPYPASAPAWVTVPAGRSGRRPRIEIRRANLAPLDIRDRRGLRVTSPPRTILDLSLVLSEGDLESVVAEGQYRRLASEAELRAQVEGNEGRRGAAKLRRVLDLPGGAKRTRSSGKRAMLRLLRRSRFSGYETNVRIGNYEVDLLWRDAGVVVEIDGWDGHSGRVAFERHRLRAATLSARGLVVYRLRVGRFVTTRPELRVGCERRSHHGSRRVSTSGA